MKVWFARKYKLLMKAHQQEKTEMGNDIHDVINPMLTYTRMTLYNLSISSGYDREKLSDVIKSLDSSILEVRKLSSWIRKTNEFSDFKNALSDMLTDHGAAYNLKVYFTYQLDESVLTNRSKANIYFILEELLLNTWRHAAATRVKVSLFMQESKVVVHYSDNGKGIPWENDHKTTGLSSIKHRISRMEGHLHYAPLNENESFNYLFSFKIPFRT
ncbi:ATP-binding protein [Siphonobacter sp. SORGH_AS_0500]|uniref:sensor histidine kinase n=1 Tax=Siphonobacter sp. SORGH_AS_0500 TaxID=1864824 RepID=UPI00285E5820|nr:ATP-binding protein [Siphonobacter sp. SORGH_AS_0500]MDR6197399.1 signal transduction histidine kinase [Siphonobacter sp. SORGH_AS_0500]